MSENEIIDGEVVEEPTAGQESDWVKQDETPIVRIVTPDETKSRKSRRDARKEAREAPKPRSANAPRYRKGMYVEPIAQIYGTVGVMLYPIDPYCGQAIMTNAQPCAESLDTLAEKNVRVRAVLESLTQTSAWGAVLAAHAPLVMAIASHHNPTVARYTTEPLHAVPDPPEQDA